MRKLHHPSSNSIPILTAPVVIRGPQHPNARAAKNIAARFGISLCLAAQIAQLAGIGHSPREVR